MFFPPYMGSLLCLICEGTAGAFACLFPICVLSSVSYVLCFVCAPGVFHRCRQLLQVVLCLSLLYVYAYAYVHM
jgi:hypothetical protein